MHQQEEKRDLSKRIFPYGRIILLTLILLVIMGFVYSRGNLVLKQEGIGKPLTPSGILNGTCNPVSLPPQGLYESCLPSDAGCLDRLSEMGSKGFKIVLNDGLRYAYTTQALRVYADHAYQLGMKVILPIKYDPRWDADDSFLAKKFPDLAQECGCTANKDFLAYYVSAIRDHPALWGYYMADEVHSEYHDGLKVYSDFVKSLDPNHPRLIVEEGTNDPMEIFFTFHSYMQDTTDVLGGDYYPYGYIDTYRQVSRYTGASARNIQYWSEKLELKSALVLQAFSWTQYYDLTHPLCILWPACAPFPSHEQMMAQRDQVLIHSRPEFLLWFYYVNILESNDPEQHWSDLVAAAFAPPPCAVPPSTPRPGDCPSGWTCEDIGNPQHEGSQSFKEGVWTIMGSGWDIWSRNFEKADQCRFVWKDFTTDGELGARVISQTKTNPSTKAGIMLRKTFDPVSPYYAIWVTPSTGIRVQYRSDFNLTPTDLASTRIPPPVYLKIDRNNTAFSAYTSINGTDWTLIPNSTINVASLNGPLLAGLAVTSRNEAAISTASFENVYLSGKP